MIKIKRNNLTELALAHYQHINVQKDGTREMPVFKLLTRVCNEQPAGDYKRTMCEELLLDITMENDDLETSILTCSPKALDEKYIHYSTEYPGYLVDVDFRKRLKQAFFYDDYDKWGAYQLAENLSVNVCPYCNRQSTFTLGTDEAHGTRPHFDHYINRKIAPYFSLSFFNLVPSCYICNSGFKGDDFFPIARYTHPYVDDYTDDVVFTLSVKDIRFADGIAEAYDLSFKRNDHTELTQDETDRAMRTYDSFKLTELYRKHKDYVDEIIIKARTYSSDYVDALYDTYRGTLFKDKEDIYRVLLSNYILLSELEKRPLAKLTRDIGRELEFLTSVVPLIGHVTES